ncbi:MATE family efflux transporter [Parablautia muri]|uniref:Multidrug export protein MepA n=1 Tax=Parablautia muri TaxID=2320879 RepID=A0A9X5GQ69_9FIRM|nr:MATE family efflux transporter [Parablautia muri]NBJ91748.1 MATE family efflux transporter [Parablautia muri]
MQNDLFEKAPVHKAYFKFALPVVFSMVISLVYNMVDTYFIAQTGNTNLVAGVSIGAPVFTLMIALGDIFGLGGSSVISRLFGQKLDDDGKRLSVFCFYAAILCGIVVAAVMLLFRQPILHLLGANGETMVYASEYYTYIVLGAPFIIVALTPSNLLRTEGFATASMTGTILGSVVNIILDPIFISALGLGAAGAAIATVLGNVCTDLFFVWFLLAKSQRLSVNPVGFHITFAEVGQIFAIGIPACITNLMQSIGMTLMNRYLLPYGNDRVAAMGIVMKVNLIAVLILVGFAFGAQPLIGYNYGAKNKVRLKEILRFCYGFECSMAAVIAVILSLAAPAMIGLFMPDASIIALGVPMLRMQQIGMVFVAVVLVTTCTFQSAGKAVGAFLLSVSRQGVIFAIVIILASRIIGYYGVLLAQAVSDILTAVLAVCLFWKEKITDL